MNYIDKWLFYPWLKGSSNDHLVKPEDIKELTGFDVVKCIGFEFDYLVLLYKGIKFRAKPEGVKLILPNPLFEWGEDVFETGIKKRKGQIIDIVWHTNKKEYFFIISVDGKILTRRYFTNELLKV